MFRAEGPANQLLAELKLYDMGLQSKPCPQLITGAGVIRSLSPLFIGKERPMVYLSLTSYRGPSVVGITDYAGPPELLRAARRRPRHRGCSGGLAGQTNACPCSVSSPGGDT